MTADASPAMNLAFPMRVFTSVAALTVIETTDRLRPPLRLFDKRSG
jgi:hypothetical protein